MCVFKARFWQWIKLSCHMEDYCFQINFNDKLLSNQKKQFRTLKNNYIDLKNLWRCNFIKCQLSSNSSFSLKQSTSNLQLWVSICTQKSFVDCCIFSFFGLWAENGAYKEDFRNKVFAFDSRAVFENSFLTKT